MLKNVGAKLPRNETASAVVRPIHGIPDIRREGVIRSGKATWFRITGLIHMLGSAEDDGPVSRVQY